MPTPTLTLSQDYEYDGKKYHAGEAVKVADPVAFAQLRRAELAAGLAADIAAEQAKAQKEAEKAEKDAAQAADEKTTPAADTDKSAQQGQSAQADAQEAKE